MIVPLFVSSETGKKTAVLTPREKNLLYGHLKTDYRIRFDFLLYTHVRIAEGYWLVDHPECFRKENGAIFLPNVEEIGKKRCTIKNRTIMLTPTGVEAVEKFFKEKVGLPRYQSMEEVLKRAGRDADFDVSYLVPKMWRKIWISWAMACFPDRMSQIQHSAGHNYATMQGHYITYGFRKDDKKDMEMETKDWGMPV
jgi:integrase